MFYLVIVNLIDTYGPPDYWTFRNGLTIVAVKMLHVEFAKNFEEKPHKTSHKNTWCHERWLSHRKTWYTEMQDANTCHIKKLWLHLKGDIFTAFFFVCLCSSNDVCFFTPYHCFCMRPAIMTDCRAKEKEINNISSALSVALLPYFFACFPLP